MILIFIYWTYCSLIPRLDCFRTLSFPITFFPFGYKQSIFFFSQIGSGELWKTQPPPLLTLRTNTYHHQDVKPFGKNVEISLRLKSESTFKSLILIFKWIELPERSLVTAIWMRINQGNPRMDSLLRLRNPHLRVKLIPWMKSKLIRFLTGWKMG